MLNEKLQRVQVALKAPKSNFNSFGKYNYRSIEDIQQAVKSHLDAEKCTLTFSDECDIIDGRVLIKANAIFSDGEDTITVSAFAEVDKVKGMNSSQAFGAASSYARKYAAGGLLLLDDTKDADSTNTHGKKESAPKPDAFAKVLEWLTANPTQDNYDRAAVKYGKMFNDEQFTKLQAVVNLANKLS